MTRTLPVLALAALLAGPAAAVTIYRFGGASLPLPPEAGLPGVVYQQMRWYGLGAAGSRTRVQFADQGGIAPIQYQPAEPLALTSSRADLAALFDLDPGTFWIARPYRCDERCSGNYGEQGAIAIDLEDRAVVERIRVRSGDTGGLGVVEDLAIHLSQFPLGGTVTPRTPFAIQVEGNREPVLDITGFPADQRTAGVQVLLAQHEHPLQISEVLIYARGRPANAASYTSDIIDFGRPAVWGAIRWSLVRAPDSGVSLTTRSGADAEILRFWRYTGVGDQRVEVTRDDYGRLRASEQAGTTYNYDDWNTWPPSFDLADTLRAPPLYPRPRRAFQFRVDFASPGEEGSRLEFVEFRASDAAVSEVVGELDPVRVEPGAQTRFTYTLKPRLAPEDAGFDRLRIHAVAARLEGVLAVSVDGFQVPFAMASLSDGQLVVGFPRVGQAQSDALVEVVFQAQVLRYGAAFAADLLDSDRPYDVPQPVPAGDASDDVNSDRLWIETSVAVRSVLDASATPAAFTPNGDGLNDRTRIAYDVFETTGNIPVGVDILDLAGRRVRAVLHAEQDIGHYEHTWDGRDDEGRPVPPGIYLYRVRADIGGDAYLRTGLLHLVY